MKRSLPQRHDTRTIKRFAFKPIEADGIWIWLEFVKIRQTYKDGAFGCQWVNSYFVK